MPEETVKKTISTVRPAARVNEMAAFSSAGVSGSV